jgi:2-polyprenyl-3-methyl-5-hydroxy-6-metoxy-1,4-benzoquinol methylase
MDKQIVQEEKYNFNYHYIPEYINGNFKHFKSGAWFIEYMSFLEYLKEYLEKINFNNLIEVGCGDGRILSELSEKYKSKKLVGIDISSKAIAFAKIINENKNIEYKNIDLKNCKQKFDIVLLIEVFEHIPIKERKNFLKNLKNIMHENSILIVTVPHKNRKMDPRHYEHFTLNSFKENFKEFNLIDYKFIAKKSFIVKIIYMLLENKFFILSHQKSLNFLFEFYKNNYLVHDEENKALRIFGVFKK